MFRLMLLSVMALVTVSSRADMPDYPDDGAGGSSPTYLGCGVYGSSSSGFPKMIYAQRVRYCRYDGPLFCNGKTQGEFAEWEHNGVSTGKQKRTIIATYNAPQKSSVDTLMYFIGGQYFDAETPKASGIGLCEDWDNLFDHSDFNLANKNIPMLPDSVPYEIATDGFFDMGRTFMAVAMDARFNYDFTRDNQHEILNAHYQWLRKKFYRSEMKFIYLVGHSRGGTLATMLASKFKDEMPEVPVFVQLYDPVANPDSAHHELGTDKYSKITNPIPRQISLLGQTYTVHDFTYRTDLFNGVFNTPLKRDRLLIHNHVAGRQFINGTLEDLSHEVRAFAELDTGTDSSGTIGNWYYQKWYTTSHSWMANLPDYYGSRYLQAAKDAYATMVPERVASMAPEARCNMSPRWAEGTQVTVSFDGNGSESRSGTALDYRWQLPNGTTRSGIGPHSATFYSGGEQLSSHSVRLTVTDANGNTDTASCSVTLEDRDQSCGDPFCKPAIQ
ncbi:PKD domain-containing protein [Microbulbifer sp. JSM ZJ756]|uniref:PKD domain-containing protein n=1 Tax=Microbulbifer sp. JSM ZJ756 TaxID=3376191 RepID=UPI00379AEED3